MSEAVIAERSVDFSTTVSSHGSYKMTQVRPLDTSDVTLTTGSTQEVLFEIPCASKAVNFGKSALSFQLNVASDGTTGSVLHSLGMACIDRIELYTRNGGQRIAEVDDFNDYHRAVAPYLTKQSEFMNNPTSRGAATANAERGYNLFPSQAALSTADPQVQAAHARSGARNDGEGSDVPYWEPQYLVSSGANAAIQIHFCMPLTQIFHTLLAQDKDLFFGSNLMLAVHFAGTDRIGYSATNPASDLAEASLLQSATQAVTIQKCELRLATETNPEIVSALVARARNGFSIRTPYVRLHAKTLNGAATAVTANHQVRLNRQAGSRLLNIYNCLFDSDNTGLGAQNLDNRSDLKSTAFQSRMNENRLQEYKPDLSEGQDYEILKSSGLLSNSVISTADMYRFNRIWVDSWRSGRMVDWPERDQDMVDGYDLQEECIYNMDHDLAASAVNYRHQMYVVTQREISVAPNGITIQ